jgi:peroxiredoxin
MKRAWIAVAVAVALSVTLCGTLTFAADEKPAPPYLSMKVAKLDEAGDVALKDVLKKEKTLLVFFQTACSACRGELSYLRDNFAGSTKVDIIGISVDVRPDQVKKYKEEYKIPFVFLSDPDYKVPAAFQVTFTPAAVLLDKEGNMVEKFLGYGAETKAALEARLK